MSHSINDVARISGVSVATVSRVINERDGVSKQARERVQRAMDQLGYVPLPPKTRRGATAKARVGGTVLVAIPDVDFLQSMNGQALKAALLDEANASGMKVEFWPVEETDEVPATVPTGLLTIRFQPEIIVNRFRARHPDVPIIHLFSQVAPPELDWIHIDHERIGSLAFDALRDWGADAFLCLFDGGHQTIGRAQAIRARTFEHEAHSHGMCVEVLDESFDQAPVEACARGIDALHALTECYGKVGIFFTCPNVPVFHQSLSTNGYDGTDSVRLACCDRHHQFTLFPAPIVIDCSIDLVAKLAMNRLEERLARSDIPPVRILVPPALVDSDAGTSSDSAL